MLTAASLANYATTGVLVIANNFDTNKVGNHAVTANVVFNG
jgi:hypothetical protein